MRKIVFSIGIVLILAVTGCVGEGPTTTTQRPGGGEDESNLFYPVIYLPDGTAITIDIVQTYEGQRLGLMYRKWIGEDEGMLFYSKEDYPPGKNLFWMKNMKFPIDMIWLDKDFKIVYIERNVPPCTTEMCPLYGPTDAVSRHVLEMKANQSSRHGLKVGDILSVKMQR